MTLAARTPRDSEPVDAVSADEAVNAILTGMTHFDERAIRLALPPVRDAADAIETIVFPALRAVGHLWESGEISVAHEHFASSVLASAVAEWHRASSASGPVQVVVATPPGEHHGFAALCADVVLRQRAVSTALLGTNTPLRAIGEAVRWTGATAVLLVATRPSAARAHASGLRALARSATVYLAGAGADADLTSMGVRLLHEGFGRGIAQVVRDLSEDGVPPTVSGRQPVLQG